MAFQFLMKCCGKRERKNERQHNPLKCCYSIVCWKINAKKWILVPLLILSYHLFVCLFFFSGLRKMRMTPYGLYYMHKSTQYILTVHFHLQSEHGMRNVITFEIAIALCTHNATATPNKPLKRATTTKKE